jgi:hypothetical protein
MPMVMPRQRSGQAQTLPSPPHFRLHSSHEAGCGMAPYWKAVAEDTMRDVRSLNGADGVPVTTPLIVWQMRVNGGESLQPALLLRHMLTLPVARRRGRDHS